MYEALVNALKATGIPFAEYQWSTRPAGDFGVVQLERSVATVEGDGEIQERAYEGSVDLYMKGRDNSKIALVKQVLTAQCGGAFVLSSIQFEEETGLLHYEWVFQLEGE